MSTDLHTLSGAYAVDALTEEEAAEFRTHLEGCAACREEVQELRETAARLGSSESVVPPAHLKASVLAAADRLPQLPPKVSPLRRSRGHRWMPRLLSAAAAVVLVLGAVVGISQLQDDSPALPVAVAGVFDASDAHTTDVDTDHGTLKVATSPSRNEMAVDTRELSDPGEGKVYQLWAITDGRPTSAGVLDDPESGRAMSMPAAGTEVAITVEPAGGSEQPTTEPIAQVDPADV